MALVDIPRVPVNVGSVVRALVSALSNKRLKLAAPVLDECGDGPTFGVVEFRL